MSRPSPAPPVFPLPGHRTMAEVMADERREQPREIAAHGTKRRVG